MRTRLSDMYEAFEARLTSDDSDGFVISRKLLVELAPRVSVHKGVAVSIDASANTGGYRDWSETHTEDTIRVRLAWRLRLLDEETDRREASDAEERVILLLTGQQWGRKWTVRWQGTTRTRQQEWLVADMTFSAYRLQAVGEEQ